MKFDPTKQPVRLQHDGKDYVVKYRHVQEEGEYKGKYSVKPTRGYTEAYMTINDDTEFAARTFCNKDDDFKKFKGDKQVKLYGGEYGC